MEYEQIILIEDYDTFKSELDSTGWSLDKRVSAIRDRRDYLYYKYRPNEEHINARRRMSRNEF